MQLGLEQLGLELARYLVTSQPPAVLLRPAGSISMLESDRLEVHDLPQPLCVTTETRPLDRLGQLGEFEQDSNTDSET